MALLDIFHRPLQCRSERSEVNNYYININSLVTVSMKRWTTYIEGEDTFRSMSIATSAIATRKTSNKRVTVKSSDIRSEIMEQFINWCLCTTLIGNTCSAQNTIRRNTKTVYSLNSHRRRIEQKKTLKVSRFNWKMSQVNIENLRKMIRKFCLHWMCICNSDNSTGRTCTSWCIECAIDSTQSIAFCPCPTVYSRECSKNAQLKEKSKTC